MITNMRNKQGIGDIRCSTVRGDLREFLGDISLTLHFDLNMYLTRVEAELIVAALKRAIAELTFEGKAGEDVK